MTEENTQIKLEDSKAVAVHQNMSVIGLEDIDMSIIPVPFYKLVQPGSTNVALPGGADAQPGTILMGDVGEAVAGFRFLLLRAKRQKREIVDDQGVKTTVPVIGILGLNLDRNVPTPFILSLSVASFSNFGQLMGAIKEKGMKLAWEYPLVLTTEKVETEKDTTRGRQKVKFWVMKFQIEGEPTDAVNIAAAHELFKSHAGNLDRASDLEEVPQTGYSEYKPENPAGSIPF